MRSIVAVLFVVSICAPLSGQAVRQTGRLDDSYVFAYTNPCSGETLLIQTEVQTYTRMVVDANGGTHFQFNGHWQYRAVSPSTGIEYVGSETGNRTILVASGGTYNETYESRGTLVSKSGADNLDIHTFMKLTITPSGEVHNDVLDQTVDCRG